MKLADAEEGKEQSAPYTFCKGIKIIWRRLMANIFVVIILLIVLSMAVRYIIKAGKKGAGCIGCPNASKCGGNCHSKIV